MFGKQPKDHTEGQTGYAVDEYQGTMQAKLAELMDFCGDTHGRCSQTSKAGV